MISFLLVDNLKTPEPSIYAGSGTFKIFDIMERVYKRMHKRSILLIIILIILFLFIFVFVCKDGMVPAPQQEPEITINGDIGYESFENEGIILKAMNGISLAANEEHQTLLLENDQNNKFVINAILMLGNGAVIYESGYLYPGESLSEINLFQPLEAGIYRNSILVYKIFSLDDEHRFISQCEFPIEITCFG